MKQITLSPLLIIASVFLSGVAPAQAIASGEEVPVRIGRTVEISLSHYRCWFPTIHQFRSGEIMVTMQMAADQMDAEAELSAYCISKDGGETWSRRYTMGEEASADGAWSEVPDSQDRIWWWGNYPEPRRPGDDKTFYVPLAKYSQGGRLVSIDRNVIVNVKKAAFADPIWLFDYLFDETVPVADSRQKIQYQVRAWGNIIRGPQGELLSDGYVTAAEEVKAPGISGAGHFLRNVLYRSLDQGRTWSEYGTIAAIPAGDRPSWMGSEGPNEGSLALLDDHRFYAVYRTGGKGMIGNSWSSDGGKTWTAPASIGFAGVAPRIHRLHNGMLALVTGRPGPVVLRFNPDGKGERWSRPIVIFAGKSTRYTDFAEIQPGKLLVVYDNIPYGWYEIPLPDRDTKNTIFGTFVEIGAP